MDSEGRVIEAVLGTELSDYDTVIDRRTSNNKLRLKTGAGSSHGKQWRSLGGHGGHAPQNCW